MNKFYVTTPIYYINDVPHIGHAYATIAADTLARYWRQQKINVFLLTGTDENSQKTVDAAEKQCLHPKLYTDKMSENWKNLWERLDITFDGFIRTTEFRHEKGVKKIFEKIYEKGDIYKGKYKGLYCSSCEEFLKEGDLIDCKCPYHKTTPDHIVEENYFFRLSKYQDKLLEYIKNNPDFIQPQSRKNEVIAFIKKGLEDISISRETQKWGLPLPIDNSHVFYVWFDALINYLTGIGYGYDNSSFNKWWPADLHIIGKDILKFHCILWPAILMSSEMKMPKQIFVHGFFTLDGQKMSKTIGNVINPLEITEKYGADALRYFVLREISFGSDGDFSREKFEKRYNSDLANDLGNLIQRVAVMISKYLNGQLPNISRSNLSNKLKREAICKKVEALKFDEALGDIWSIVSDANKYIDKEKPWTKSEDKKEIEKILSNLLTSIFEINWLIEPFLPNTSEKIRGIFKDGKVGDFEPLFPKLN